MRVYLDYNATAPLRPEARARVLACWDAGWGNPASVHASGRAARRALEEARAEVASGVGAAPSEVVFTSGASEGLAAGLWGMARAVEGRRARLALGATEHPAALAAARGLEAAGLAEVRLVGVDRDGLHDLEALAAALSWADGLCLMAANHETGALSDLAAVGAAAARAGVPWLCDATQLVGRLPLAWGEHPAITALAWSAHKLGGPVGVGALALRRGVGWAALLPGAQEGGRRGGTANVAGASGFAGATGAALAALDAGEAARLAGLRDRLQSKINEKSNQIYTKLISIQYNSPAARLPNTLHLTLRRGEELVDAEGLLLGLSARGVDVSTGAACASGERRPSPVLLAMGRTPAEAHASLRLSLGYASTAGCCDVAADALAAAWSEAE